MFETNVYEIDLVDPFHTLCLISDNKVFVIRIEPIVDDLKKTWTVEFLGYFKQTLMNRVIID